jgi:hypothetical protein
MPTENEQGGYIYSPGLRFASNGVVAMPGNTIERAALPTPAPFERGCAAVERHLAEIGRPIDALCGLELRLPATLPLEEFVAFNDRYLAQLEGWNLVRDGISPLTRTNVSPSAGAPSEPTLIAFSYTVPGEGPEPCFVISGIAEMEVAAKYPEGIVRRGEHSAEAMAEKAACVVRVVNGHIRDLGAEWTAAAAVHLYSAHPIAFDLSRRTLPELGVAPAHGIIWHDAAPPVVDLELEVDVRRYGGEVAILA